MSPSLAERLKSETRELHAAAERSPFMGELLRGRISRSAYARLLTDLQAIYLALEQALLRHAANPALAPVLLPGLVRAPSLAQDLVVLQALPGAPAEEPGRVAARYVRRLQAIESSDPALLLAHGYVRYLGDLNGGQVLGRIVSRMLGLSAGSGTAFYDFGGPILSKALVGAFRDSLAQVVFDPAEAETVVAEARLAFDLHIEMFAELAQRCGIAAAG